MTTVASKIGVPGNNGIDYINVDEILYFEAVRGYTNVVTTHATILSSFRLGKFREIIEGHTFYQVHRSYIINVNHVRRYNLIGEVVMVNDKEIPVSKNLREEFLHLFNMVSRSGE
jgi:two-component system LytT family response regulator